MTIKLWHCHNARSLRPLWALEEMQLDYELEVLPFPPRYLQKEFLEQNVLGTVPYLTDLDTKMTESSGMCHYLAERYNKTDFCIAVDHAEYGDYLNWMYHSDATLTFPQTIYLRYAKFESPERRSEQVANDYRLWFLARLRLLDQHIASREYLCDQRFTMADIAIGYALYLGKLQGLDADYTSGVNDYLTRLMARDAFIKAVSLSESS